MGREAVAQGLSSLFVTGLYVHVYHQLLTSGFDVTLTGKPNFDVISRLFVLDLGHSSLIVPIKYWFNCGFSVLSYELCIISWISKRKVPAINSFPIKRLKITVFSYWI